MAQTGMEIAIDECRLIGLGGGYYKQEYVVGRFQTQRISLSNCPRGVVVGGVIFPNLWTSRKCRTILPITAFSDHSRASETAVDGEDHLRTVQVKFQLQKACGFGDHFLMVGDDPLLGSWDPENAIKMEWSDGHLWTAEVDIPVEKKIQFKLILKQCSGDITWQPGPDRVFMAWTTTKTITVVEDWENSELQKIVGEGVPGHDDELLLRTGGKSLEESQQANNSQLSKNSLLDVTDYLTFSENLTIKNSKMVGSAVEEGSYPEKESSISMMVAHNIVSDHRRSSSAEGLEDEEVILADPVLVPGLAPSISTLSTDGSPLTSKDKNCDLDGSLRCQDSNDPTALETCSNLKAESEEVKFQRQQETQPSLFSRQENHKGVMEEPKESLKVELEDEQKADVRPRREKKTKMKFSDEIEFDNSYLNEVESQNDMAIQDIYRVLKNVIRWGRENLQNLLSSFGLL